MAAGEGDEVFDIVHRWPEAVMHRCESCFVLVPKISCNRSRAQGPGVGKDKP